MQQADNAGFDATDLLNRLRQKHAREGDAGKWFGVDVDTEGGSKIAIDCIRQCTAAFESLRDPGDISACVLCLGRPITFSQGTNGKVHLNRVSRSPRV